MIKAIAIAPVHVAPIMPVTSWLRAAFFMAIAVIVQAASVGPFAI